jgi:hypothetical protein
MNIRFRPRPIAEPEYDVAWSGTMAGAGARPTTPAPPLPPDRFSRYDVLAVLRRAPAVGLTMREIAAALETTLPRVNSLLRSLLQVGQVVAEETAIVKCYGGQLRRYRAVGSPLHDVGRARGAHARGDVSAKRPANNREEQHDEAVDRRRAHPKPRASRRTE